MVSFEFQILGILYNMHMYGKKFKYMHMCLLRFPACLGTFVPSFSTLKLLCFAKDH